MKLQFVSLLATDNVQLPGLLYEPDKPTARVALWLHGMGDSGVFYKPVLINALAEALTQSKTALLAFNNRGAHGSKLLKIADESLPENEQRFQGGTHFETITDCVADIDGAAHFLRQNGFKELYLMGHSSGANKICVYHAARPANPFSKYVLAGPGDDTGLFYNGLGAKRFKRALAYAQEKAETSPLHIMPKYTGMHPFSARSALDILDPDGAYNTFPYYEAKHQRLGAKELFKEYRRIDRPVLIIIGGEDEYTSTAGGADAALRLLLQHTSNQQLKQTDGQLVHGADHSFCGQEPVFAARIADWLAGR